MLSKERKQAKNVSKREIWESFNADTQEFLKSWPKGAIVEVENITRGLIWKK